MVRGVDDHADVALLGERPGRVDDPVGDVDQVDVVGLEDGGAGVEPADLEQVGEQRLEPVELGLQQLGRARGHRVEAVAGVVQHVAGHPHGRERRAQLVGDVGDEAALHPAELLELADLALQVAGHLVERGRQPREVVLAGHLEPLLELAGGEPLGDPAGHPDRRDDLTGHQPGHAGDQHQQQRGGGEQGPGDQRERLLLLVEREEVVERVGLGVGREQHLRADDDRRLLGRDAVLGGPHRGVGPGGRRRGVVEVLLERLRDAAGVQVVGERRAAVGDPRAGLGRADQDDGEAAGLAALDHDPGQRLLLLDGVAAGRPRRVEEVLGGGGLVARPPPRRRRPGGRAGPRGSAGAGTSRRR